jgi:two-component system, OmpR family, response regulator
VSLSPFRNVIRPYFVFVGELVARKRLLVVEDYQQLRDLIATVLQEVGGYAVETASDGTAADRLIAEQRFELVILDISVPGRMGGQDIASLARARLGCPILFITGRDLALADCADLMQPRDRFLRKPFKMDVLLAEVGAVLKVDAPKTLNAPKRARVRASRAKRTPTGVSQ